MLRSKIQVPTTQGPGGVAVSHNLGVVPNFVYVTAKSNDVFWVPWADATYVGICSTAAGNPCELLAIVDHSIIK